MTDHITLPRSVVEQAIEALEDAQWIQEHHQDEEKRCDAIEALRAALAGAAQAEPFGYMLHWPKPGGGTSMLFHKTPSAGEAIGCKITPIYTAPQPAQPVAVLIPGPSGDVLTDFQHGQWWVAEIEAALLSGTSDQIRAVATLRNLLNTIQTQFNAAPPAPAATVLTDAEIMDIWRLADQPCEENDWTTGPVPFARLVIEAAILKGQQ